MGTIVKFPTVKISHPSAEIIDPKNHGYLVVDSFDDAIFSSTTFTIDHMHHFIRELQIVATSKSNFYDCLSGMTDSIGYLYPMLQTREKEIVLDNIIEAIENTKIRSHGENCTLQNYLTDIRSGHLVGDLALRNPKYLPLQATEAEHLAPIIWTDMFETIYEHKNDIHNANHTIANNILWTLYSCMYENNCPEMHLRKFKQIKIDPKKRANEELINSLNGAYYVAAVTSLLIGVEDKTYSPDGDISTLQRSVLEDRFHPLFRNRIRLSTTPEMRKKAKELYSSKARQSYSPRQY